MQGSISRPGGTAGLRHPGMASPGLVDWAVARRITSLVVVAATFWLAPCSAALSKDFDTSNSGWLAITISRDINDFVEFSIKSVDSETVVGKYHVGSTWFSKYPPDFDSVGPVSKIDENVSDKNVIADMGDKFNQNVIVVKLPAGNYSIYQLYVARPDGKISRYRNFDEIPFSVKIGKVTYLGQYEMFPMLKTTMFKNIYVVGGWTLNISNQIERDNSIIITRTGLPAGANDVPSQPNK
jgi:hypothetical protein